MDEFGDFTTDVAPPKSGGVISDVKSMGFGGFMKNRWDTFKQGGKEVSTIPVGFAKGAGSTVGSVVQNVGKVTGGFVGLHAQNQMNESMKLGNDVSNKIIEQRNKFALGTPDYDRYQGLLKQQVDSQNKMREQQQASLNEIDSTTSAFGDKPDWLTPQNAGEKLGYGAEKIAEFVYAGKKISNPAEAYMKSQPLFKTIEGASKLSKVGTAALRVAGGTAIDAATSGLVTAAQGGDLKEIGHSAKVAALFSAPLRAAGEVISPVVSHLRESAEKKASQALGATGKANKDLSDRVVPEMLKKRVTFMSRAGLESKAGAMADDLGEQIDDAWSKLPKDSQINIAPTFKKIEDAKDALVVAGTNTVPQAAEAKYKALQSIQQELLGLAKDPDKAAFSLNEVQKHIKMAREVMDDPAFLASSADEIPINKISNIQGASLDDARAMSETTRHQLQSSPVGTELGHGFKLNRPITDPISVATNADGTFSVPDGAHRLRQALINGDETIPGLVDLPAGTDVKARATQQLFGRIKTNIVDGLKAQGVTDIAKSLDGIDPTKYNSLDDFSKAIFDTIKPESANISAESVRSYRQILDGAVKSKSGAAGFGLTGDETAALTAQKTMANAVRDNIAKDHPDIAKINAEFNFWKNVETVVGNTVKRTKSQATPLTETVAEGAGFVGGMVRGGKALTAVVGAVSYRLFMKAITSPAWRMTSAVTRTRLADALASGNGAEVAKLSQWILTGAAGTPKEKESPEASSNISSSDDFGDFEVDF